MEWLWALLLGIVQGLTEFIPVSSSAHLIVLPWLFGVSDESVTNLPFDVALHMGTLVAVLVYFADDWVRLIRGWLRSVRARRIAAGDTDARLAWMLVAGSVPGAIAGLLFESRIEELFHAPNEPVSTGAILALAAILALMGVALFVAERAATHVRRLEAISWRDALLIGAAQAAAIFPGVSRSGATITSGLALGLQRPAAARFSFLLSAPIIAGAGLKNALDVALALRDGSLPASELALFPIGFVAAALSGYLCIRFLLRYLQRHSTDVFVAYRLGLAALLIVVAVVRG